MGMFDKLKGGLGVGLGDLLKSGNSSPAPKSGAKCAKCGADMASEAKFCPSCGAQTNGEAASPAAVSAAPSAPAAPVEIDLYEFNRGNMLKQFGPGMKFKSRAKFNKSLSTLIAFSYTGRPGNFFFKITKDYPRMEKGQEVTVCYTVASPGTQVDLDGIEGA
jgi:hypothetical protein